MKQNVEPEEGLWAMLNRTVEVGRKYDMDVLRDEDIEVKILMTVKRLD